METILQKWIPTILLSFLFFKVVQIVLGSLFQGFFSQLARPKVLAIVVLLFVLGVIPLAIIDDALVVLLVSLFSIIRTAYGLVVGGALAS